MQNNDIVKMSAKLPAQQGDLYFRAINKLPEDITAVNAVNGFYVLAHSESGHDHIVLEDERVEYYQSSYDLFLAFMKIALTPVDLIHKKTGPDAHKTIRLPPGLYEFRRQTEITPEGLRRVED